MHGFYSKIGGPAPTRRVKLADEEGRSSMDGGNIKGDKLSQVGCNRDTVKKEDIVERGTRSGNRHG